MEWASWGLSIVGAIGVYVSGKSRWGWLISVLYQILWIAYAVVSDQYGFIWVCVLYSFLYGKNFIQGGKSERSNSDDRTSGVGKDDVGSSAA